MKFFILYCHCFIHRKFGSSTMSESSTNAEHDRWPLANMPEWLAWWTSCTALDCVFWPWDIIHHSCTLDPLITIAIPRWLARQSGIVATRSRLAWCPSPLDHLHLCSLALEMFPKVPRRCSPSCPLSMFHRRCYARWPNMEVSQVESCIS